jgi:hypothetical protein
MGKRRYSPSILGLDLRVVLDAYFISHLIYLDQSEMPFCGITFSDSEQNNRLTCLFSKLSLVVPTKRDIAPHEGDETKSEISSTLSFEFTSFTKFMANDNYKLLLYK